MDSAGQQRVVVLVQDHLSDVRNNPALSLDHGLLRMVNSHNSDLVSDGDRYSILGSCAALIPILQQDPDPLLELVDVLVSPESFTFTRVLDIEPPVDFVAGLSSTFVSLNFTTLGLLRKATQSESDADIVAGRPQVVAALIKLWLCTPDIGVCDRAREVLLGLLKASKQGSSRSASFDQSLMWRRVFRDRDMYGLIFSICSLKTVGNPGQISARAKTIAQGRLPDLLVELVDCEPIHGSQFPEIETKYGVEDGGLLKFAAVYMIDSKHDPLMHTILIAFFTNMLRTRSPAALNFLIENGLHDSTTAFYINGENMSQQLLAAVYPEVAEYIAVYCSNFEAHLLSNHGFVDRLLDCLDRLAEHAVSIQQRLGFPPHCLKILASLPRAVLFPRNSSSTPLFRVFPNCRDTNTYKALAKIFRGSGEPTPQDRSRYNENSAARALYFLYIKEFPSLWKIVCRDAQVVALKDLALAAIGLIEAVISANWELLPTEAARFSPAWLKIPTEQELASASDFGGQQLPSSGLLTILDSLMSQEVVAYLCSALPAFRNFAGGRGYFESSAYQIAVAKYDVMKLLRQKLKDVVEARPELQNILTTVEGILAKGLTCSSSDVGGRVGTLEL